MDKVIIANPVSRKHFVEIASNVTGLKPKSADAMTKVERNRKPNGSYDTGFRYTLVAKRADITVQGLRKK